MPGRLIAGIKELWHKAAALAGDQRHRMSAAREIAALDPHERDRILGEAGLERWDIAGAMRTPFVSEDLLSQAMNAIGVDPADFQTHHGLWHRDMERLCMACQARSRCRRDLATHDFARRYRHYCPNAISLGEIVAGLRAETTTRPVGRA